jgi:hypothetical protein
MKLIDLLSESDRAPIRKDVKNILPHTDLITAENGDQYRQYRYMLALAAAKAVDNGEVEMYREGPWGEMTPMVYYAPQEKEIVDLTNKLMGYGKITLANSSSKEPSFVNKASPVRPFKEID